MIPELLLNDLEHPRRREASETADFQDVQLLKAGTRISIIESKPFLFSTLTTHYKPNAEGPMNKSCNGGLNRTNINSLYAF